MEPKLIQVETRLLAIPILFILLRMWGTIQFLFSLAVAGTVHEGCVPNSVHIAFVVLGILQVSFVIMEEGNVIVGGVFCYC